MQQPIADAAAPVLGDPHLRRREKGWKKRADSVTERKGKPRTRKPQISRYGKVADDLRGSPVNANASWVDTKGLGTQGTTYDTVDLFAGCGGLTLGFEQANYRPVLGVEMDPDASATYRRNFPEAHVWADRIEDLSDARIRKIVGKRTIHVLLAGFPCQGFSVAGQRNPKDERNVLFRQVVRVAKLLKPWYLVMENVPGVVTMSQGRTFRAIHQAFVKVGYPGMSTHVLEAASYGVPQLRPRAVFIANRLGMRNPYPKPILAPKDYVPIEAAIDDLKLRPRDPRINHDWTRHSAQMEARIAKVEPGGSLYDSFYDAWKRQYRGVPSMTIKENHGGSHIHHELNRTISAREMARLQSFPDSFLFEGRMKRVMFQVGNAVAPRFAHHVALALRPSLAEAERRGAA